jgi:hypothetical protein
MLIEEGTIMDGELRAAQAAALRMQKNAPTPRCRR